MPVPLMSQLSGQRWTDESGRPLIGGKLYFYQAGSTTPKSTYTTKSRTIQHTNPIVIPASGVIPTIWLGAGEYRLVLSDAEGVLYEEADEIQGEIPDPPTTTLIPDLSTVWPVGSIRSAFSYATVAGWVRANGLTIGKAGSGATEFAGDDAWPLFEMFWNQIPGLSVSSGRGVSASADWSALKTLALPDARGLTLAGRDGMGNALAGRLPLDLWTYADSLGAFHGAAKKSLTADEGPTHAHAATIGTAGSAHRHSGTTDAGGAHYHEYWDTGYNLDGQAATGTTVTGRSSPAGTSRATNPSTTHTHTFATAEGEGEHVHDATIAASGQGKAFSLFQPTILVTHYIKL